MIRYNIWYTQEVEEQQKGQPLNRVTLHENLYVSLLSLLSEIPLQQPLEGFAVTGCDIRIPRRLAAMYTVPVHQECRPQSPDRFPG